MATPIYFNNLTTDMELSNPANYSTDVAGTEPYTGALDSTIDVYMTGQHANVSLNGGVAYITQPFVCVTFHYDVNLTTLTKIQWNSNVEMYGEDIDNAACYLSGLIEPGAGGAIWAHQINIYLQGGARILPCIAIVAPGSLVRLIDGGCQFKADKYISQPCLSFGTDTALSLDSAYIWVYESFNGHIPIERQDGVSGHITSSYLPQDYVIAEFTYGGQLGVYDYLFKTMSAISGVTQLQIRMSETYSFTGSLPSWTGFYLDIYNNTFSDVMNLTLEGDIQVFDLIIQSSDSGSGVGGPVNITTPTTGTFNISSYGNTTVDIQNASSSINFGAGATVNISAYDFIMNVNGVFNRGGGTLTAKSAFRVSCTDWVSPGTNPVIIAGNSGGGSAVLLDFACVVNDDIDVTAYSYDPTMRIDLYSVNMGAGKTLTLRGGEVGATPLGNFNIAGTLKLENISAIRFQGARGSPAFDPQNWNIEGALVIQDDVVPWDNIIISDIDMRNSPIKLPNIYARRAVNGNWGQTAGIDFRRNPV
jgi:hypothetical protein